ncbi:CRISPR-associated helicase/endonuclease Cas3 [Deinococcus wulumuqiensis]|uniref:CRISPR-associated helicase/endonuclease Cas3 n=1 Tax=Deinococcus wulumuqiensis TaxID=980427 RepID=A0AAV4K503_9DEIO|nr:CRISPR-associated helicase/endonuclease Cas3 [Deinococcus wulumuqiensis]QII22434.1 CRISPR-associated helicase/endonuclease Cas3 [Deinococcus wulumuqiensis R12]GGI85641.1 CRISPR-associated helicase/endonuclease Cas3 [Deinococcus wulumuqiensis]GGP30155.1 CRISPR-associated helicase/endonuclease Cas3 [Deinococcus wulumuqiensis]
MSKLTWVEDYWAHTPSDGSGGQPHDLLKHLQDTAKLAQQFAKIFDAGNLAYLLGIWHDLGKYNPEFQQYLRDAKKAEEQGQELGRKGPPHAVWGAMLLQNRLGQHPQASTFTLPVLGHHAGLEDAGEGEQKILGEPETSERLEIMQEAIQTFGLQPSGTPEKIPTQPYQQELFTRMVTSALVDADFLDTEKHFGQERPEARQYDLDIPQLWQRFEAGRQKLLDKQQKNGKKVAPHVQKVRDEVYAECLKAAEGKPGLYRLTVPTGGGKTLSGLAFALKHALKNDLRRVIVAIPYTSIIDQNAKVYRDVLGDDAVLEHHSAVETKSRKAGPDQQAEDAERKQGSALRMQLASENWDMLLICTTFVQLFESLFARKTSKLRKLHRIARSVIVLDEVHTLPPELRAATLDVMRTLIDDYGVSVVLCTATQPAFETDELTAAFKNLSQTEIVPQYADHFRELTRVKYALHPEYPNPAAWNTLASEMKTEPQILTILNTRKDSLALIRELQSQNTEHLYHLSTLMCGAHRKKVLAEINARLDDKTEKRPVRLVSTQVVEAGVDLDFPVVYRALAPLDRIVQAAGRCNRNGNGEALGRVVIFQTLSGKAPKGPYQKGIEKARTLLETSQNIDHDMNGTEILRRYFSMLYGDVHPDELHIQPLRRELEFRKVAETYRLIRDDTVSIIVPYGDYLKALIQWQHFPSRKSWRALQPYVVSIYTHEARQLAKGGAIRELEEGVYLFEAVGQYDPLVGLPIDRDPADLIYIPDGGNVL